MNDDESRPQISLAMNLMNAIREVERWRLILDRAMNSPPKRGAQPLLNEAKVELVQKRLNKREKAVAKLAATVDLRDLEEARENALEIFREKGRDFEDGSIEDSRLSNVCKALNLALSVQADKSSN